MAHVQHCSQRQSMHLTCCDKVTDVGLQAVVTVTNSASRAARQNEAAALSEKEGHMKAICMAALTTSMNLHDMRL